MRVLNRIIVAGTLIAGLLGAVPTSLVPVADAEESEPSGTCEAHHPQLTIGGGSWRHLRYGEPPLHVRLEGFYIGHGPEGINDGSGFDMSLDWDMRVSIYECGEIPIASGHGVAETASPPYSSFYDGEFVIPEVCPAGSEKNIGDPVPRGNASLQLSTVDADGDSSGRLTEVAEAEVVLATYAYDDAANSVTRTQGNGVSTTTAFDQDGLVESVVETDPASTVLSQTTYEHDGNGNPTMIDRDGTVQVQRFDELNRLVEVCYAADCVTATDFVEYGYDENGNVVSETTPAGVATYTYDGFDQLVSSQGPDGPRTYTYDVAGNRLSGPGVTQSVNAAGQVVERTVDGVTTTYAYDGSGLMLSSTTAGATTVEYDYDPVSAQLVGERDGASVVRAYAYGRELLAVQASDQVSFYATDELGSVRTVRGPTGQVQHSYDYAPYGGLRAHNATAGAPENPLLFTGGYSADAGLTYRLGFRAYDPGTKVFTTPDQGGTGAAYRYASANPAVFTDQLGLYSFDNFLQDVNRVSGWVATGATVVAIGCTAAVFCAPAAPVAGGIATVGAAVNVASGSALAAGNCMSTKGSCAATVGMAAIGAFGSRFGAGKLTTAANTGPRMLGVGPWGQRVVDARTKLPGSWGPGVPNKKGVGTRWFDPSNPGNGVRIDQGLPGSPQLSQQVDHVVVRGGGKVIGPDGKPIVGSLSDNPQAHIPLTDWMSWSSWSAP